MFLDPGAQTFYQDWESNTRQVVTLLRVEAGPHPTDAGVLRGTRLCVPRWAATAGELWVDTHSVVTSRDPAATKHIGCS
ncbi:hypothetical protein [Arthrobacter ipis]|uniref:MmyB family transcriptional regulator n=1 Tax=Arthrobacter ipis TaxID=2716202 RepID=UPI00288B8A57|nr:hypothetical protein [Arthrobacter ipis]